MKKLTSGMHNNQILTRIRDERKLKANEKMNNFYILIIRLLLGGAFGTLLTRIFRPEWNLIYGGAGIGIGLVVAAYMMEAVGKRKKKNQ